MADYGMNCAQSVLCTFSEEFGLHRDLAVKLAQGFGQGMARLGNTCGAVTAAYMVLGLSQITSYDDPSKSRETTYELMHEFNQRFEALHGSLVCRDLIGYDLSTPQGLAEARKKKVFSVCPSFAGDSVKILETLLKL